MVNNSFISYLRVSTAQQGASGLGLESQEKIVSSFVYGKGIVLASYVEVESGKINERPELQRALQHCLMTGATLVIAKLDRLSRDALFLLTLQKSSVTFICCDMPFADKFTVGIMALIAEKEREMISSRTKAALSVLKSRGVKMGGKAHNKGNGLTVHKERVRSLGNEARSKRKNEYQSRLAPVVMAWRDQGRTIAEICELLRSGRYQTPSGKSDKWSTSQVFRLLSSR